jgi:hypothetical protein
MSVKTINAEELLKEGEYETQFGKIVIDKIEGGYKITFYINGAELGRNLAKQIALSLVGPYLAKKEQPA